jgi:hypothetical protein
MAALRSPKPLVGVRVPPGMPKDAMYNVMIKNGTILNASPTLADAMAYARGYGEFVIIQGPDFEVCGKFGVDSIEDARLPDGNEYTWKMRRDEVHRSWRRKKT